MHHLKVNGVVCCGKDIIPFLISSNKGLLQSPDFKYLGCVISNRRGLRVHSTSVCHIELSVSKLFTDALIVPMLWELGLYQSLSELVELGNSLLHCSTMYLSQLSFVFPGTQSTVVTVISIVSS